MFNNKIASLEARLARLESKLFRKANFDSDNARWNMNTLAGAIEYRSRGMISTRSQKNMGNTGHISIWENKFRNQRNFDLTIVKGHNEIILSIYEGDMNGRPDWQESVPLESSDSEIANTVYKALYKDFRLV